MITKPEYEDFNVPVKFKLAALWTAVMFCYIYGDFFTLFVPGRIQNLMNGDSGVGKTTPLMILAFAILLSLPPLMIWLSLVLKPKANRILNLIMGTFFTLIMILTVMSSIDSWMLFYIYLGVVEIVLTIAIVIYAWTWPRHVNS